MKGRKEREGKAEQDEQDNGLAMRSQAEKTITQREYNLSILSALSVFSA